MAEYFKCGGYDADGYPCRCEKVELIPGPRGPKGRKGERGENLTSTHLYALHTGGSRLTAAKAGTAVPLPDGGVKSGFAANAEYTAFTVPETGVYFLTYHVKTAKSAQVKTRIVRNESPLPGSVRSACVPDAFLSATLIAPLSAGDLIELQLYDFDGDVRIPEGEGASLAAVRLA